MSCKNERVNYRGRGSSNGRSAVGLQWNRSRIVVLTCNHGLMRRSQWSICRPTDQSDKMFSTDKSALTVAAFPARLLTMSTDCRPTFFVSADKKNCRADLTICRRTQKGCPIHVWHE